MQSREGKKLNLSPTYIVGWLRYLLESSLSPGSLFIFWQFSCLPSPSITKPYSWQSCDLLYCDTQLGLFWTALTSFGVPLKRLLSPQPTDIYWNPKGYRQIFVWTNSKKFQFWANLCQTYNEDTFSETPWNFPILLWNQAVVPLNMFPPILKRCWEFSNFPNNLLLLLLSSAIFNSPLQSPTICGIIVVIDCCYFDSPVLLSFFTLFFLLLPFLMMSHALGTRQGCAFVILRCTR